MDRVDALSQVEISGMTSYLESISKWFPAGLLILFNLLWLFIAFSAKNGMVLMPFFLTVGYCFLAAICFKIKLNQIFKLFILLVVGLSFDSALIFFEGISILSGELVQGILPIWLVSVWLGFVFTLPFYFTKLNSLLLILVLALFAPLSYFAAQNIGILNVNNIGVWLLMSLFWTGFAVLGRKIYFSQSVD